MSKIDPREVTLPLTMSVIETGWMVTDAKGKTWAFNDDTWSIHYYMLEPIAQLAKGTYDNWIKEGEDND